ncbi:MAG TPA: pitrilysin family protein [Candidatus Caenarcaniphilales bacterium]
MVQAPPQLTAPILHQLSNGLTIVAEQMPIEAVNFSLWVRAGSAKESDAINGLAHFLEHMVFKGTAHLDSGEFERLIEQRGGITNAATSQDYTFYYVTVAPQDFAAVAPLQLDVVFNASIPETAFERERLVVLEEIRRAEDNPRRRVFYQAMELAFDQLPYRRPVLGPAKIVEQLTPQQMRDFHQSWYQPEAITAVAVGNLPVEKLIQTIEGELAAVKRRPIPVTPNWQQDASFSEVVRHEFVDPRLQQARLIMLWRVPGMEQLNQTYALDVLAKILGQGRTSRLIKDLREDKGWVTNLSVSNMTQAFQGVFYISAQLPAENLSVVESAIALHIQSLQAEPVTSAELAQAQIRTANQFIFGNETPASRANLYGYYQAIAADLPAALSYPAQIRAVTPEDLQVAAQRYLATQGYGVVVSRPATA